MTNGRSKYLFTALACEAKAFINYFKLKKRHDLHAFTLYENKEIVLTVTGIGQSAMAAGVAYSLAVYPCISPILMNIGIAGHANYDLGTLYIVDKVSNEDATQCYYPQFIKSPDCPSHQLISVSNPETVYATNTLYDMEAIAFYQIASRFSSCEFIHCFKVISDNKQNNVEHINAQQVSLWLANICVIIDDFLIALSLLKFSIQVLNSPDYQRLINQQHFTHNEKIQLQSLLRKHHVLMPDKSLIFDNMSAKNILKTLENILLKHPFGGF